MKKILIILLVTALIGCSNTSRNTENNAEKINTGINSLITEKEKQDLSNGKSLSVITIDNPSHGVLGDGLGALVSKVRGNDKQTMTAVNLILNNPDTIFVSQNSPLHNYQTLKPNALQLKTFLLGEHLLTTKAYASILFSKLKEYYQLNVEDTYPSL